MILIIYFSFIQYRSGHLGLRLINGKVGVRCRGVCTRPSLPPHLQLASLVLHRPFHSIPTRRGIASFSLQVGSSPTPHPSSSSSFLSLHFWSLSCADSPILLYLFGSLYLYKRVNIPQIRYRSCFLLFHSFIHLKCFFHERDWIYFLILIASACLDKQ